MASFTKNATAATITSKAKLNPDSPRRTILQNYLLIWVDETIDQSDQNCQHALEQLQNVFYEVHMFDDVDECVDFLTDVDSQQVFLITSATLGQQLMPHIHFVPLLNSIYILCHSQSQHEQWAKQWFKVKGMHTHVKTICEALQVAVTQYNQDSIPMSFLQLDESIFYTNLNQLDPSFMYTKLFKDVLLEMKHDEWSVQNLLSYCREHKANASSKLLEEFERNYRSNKAIWWYTRTSFTYHMMNQALRLMEGAIIVNMGFFIRDLHQQIQKLHNEQGSQYHEQSFIVYRGQGLLVTDFEKLNNTRGGLMSFNSFLSTSKRRDISFGFAEIAATMIDMVGILFVMTIDLKSTSTPFANIKDVSYFGTEEEVLFSMHTVFRIGDIKTMDEQGRLYEVQLTLTTDDDEQLRTLMSQLYEEIQGDTGWAQLGHLLLKVGQAMKAEELFIALLKESSSANAQGYFNHQLGVVKIQQGDYKGALAFAERALDIRQKALPANHPHLAASYSNIGLVYEIMGEYLKTLSFFEKALDIEEKTLSAIHPSLAASYSNIGSVYMSMGEHLKALSFYEKALNIHQKNLPVNHPDLAIYYNNISAVYLYMGNYSKTQFFCEKALDIRQKTLPANHPSLTTSYNNICKLYTRMGNFSKAMSFSEKALAIQQKILPVNHLDFADSYNSIAIVYTHMGEYSKALSFYEKELDIKQKNLLTNHPDLSLSYNNIAIVYTHMGEYSKALSFYEKALDIEPENLSANHPYLANIYNNIGGVYASMGDYSKAISFYEKVLDIFQKTHLENHSDLITFYSNIGEAHKNMKEYSKALSFFQRVLDIRQKTLSAIHPDLATSYTTIGVMYMNMEEYSKALSFYEKALDIEQKTLPGNHTSVATSYNNIGLMYYKIADYSKALSCLQRAQDIFKLSLPPTHLHLRSVRNSIEIVKKNLSSSSG